MNPDFPDHPAAGFPAQAEPVTPAVADMATAIAAAVQAQLMQQFQDTFLGGLNELRGQQAELRAQLEATRQQPPAPTTVVPPPPAPAAPVPATPTYTNNPKVAKPDKFDGTRSKLDGFLVQVQLNFLMNPRSFENDQQKIAFVASYFTGQALQWVTPLIKKNDQVMATYDTFYEALKKRFSDPDEVRKAEHKLENLKQGTRSAAAYAAEFQLEASKTLWDDASKKSRFREGLRDDVLDLLLTIPASKLESFEGFVNEAISCDDRLFERRQDKARRLRDTRPSAPAQAPTSAKTSSAVSNSSYTGPAPMEIGTTRQVVTEAEKQRRRDNNLCIYCGAEGHILRNCPVRPRQATTIPRSNQQRVNATEAETLASQSPNGQGPRDTSRA